LQFLGTNAKIEANQMCEIMGWP